MPNTDQKIYRQIVSTLQLDERLPLAAFILNDIVQQYVSIIEDSDIWVEPDKLDLVTFAL